MTAQTSMPEANESCRVVAFPLARRIGRIREVARKLNGKSRAAASCYELQVTGGMLAHLERLGVDEAEQERQIDSFWAEVNMEVSTLICGSGQSGGDDLAR
jgi:hypothetical protein